MKVKDIILKWKSEGISDEVIRKRLIVLTQQNNGTPEFDDTQDNEAIQTQTQLDVPVIVGEDGAHYIRLTDLKNTQLLLFAVIGINIIIIFCTLYMGSTRGNRIDELQNQIEELKASSIKEQSAVKSSKTKD
jgi:hypothetical protein